MRKIIISFIFILLSLSVFSQHIDSLLVLLDSEKDKNVKIDLLVELFAESIEENFLDAAEYSDMAIKLAEKDENSEKIIETLLNFGKITFAKNFYTEAIKYYQLAVEYSGKIGNDSLTALSLHKSGNILISQNKYQEAVKLYIKALGLREKINDIEGIAATTNNIGLVYWYMEQYNKAIEYFTLSMENEKIINNLDGIASSLNNLGLIYWKAYQELDTALLYIQKSLELKIELKDEIGVATAYNNLGIIYRQKKEYQKAIYYFMKAVNMHIKFEIFEEVANGYNNVASVYYYEERIDSAIYFYNKSIQLADSLCSYRLLQDSYNGLAVVYYLKGDFQTAYDFKDLAIAYRDSVYTQDVADQIAEMETKYETDKVEKENEIQKLKLSQELSKSKTQRTIIYFFAFVLFIILVFSFLILKQYKAKKKANQDLEMRNAEILQQKEEIEAQSENLNEAYQKISFFNEQIKASIRYGQTIQKALLPYESTMNNIFDNFVIYRPKDVVSGDFYWVNEIEGSKYIAVVDCTGHGVPGAFMSMIGISLLDEILIAKKITNPKDVLEKLHQSINIALNQSKTNNSDGMDLSLCKIEKIDSQNFKITFAGAKSDLLYSDFESNNFVKLKGTRRSIGGYQTKINFQFEQNEIILKKDSILILFSDGIIDQNNFARNKFGSSNFIRILNNNIRNSLEQIKNNLEFHLNDFQKNELQRDDITVVGIKL